MTSTSDNVKRFLRSEDGNAATMYLVMLALIIIAGRSAVRFASLLTDQAFG